MPGDFRWRKQWDNLLGCINDSELAKRLKVHRNTVSRHRNKLGIPANRSRKFNLAKFKDLLGEMTDASIARIFDCSIVTIRERRRRLEIPIYKREEMKPYLFIDGNHLCFRSYFLLATKTGIGKHADVSNAICYGFINSFMSLMKRFNGKRIIVCWDDPPYFRYQIYKNYKGNRPAKDDRYLAAIIFCKEMLRDIGIVQLSIPGLEADDLVGIFTHLMAKKGKKCLIVTDDKDYFQLLRKSVKIYRPGKNEVYTVNHFRSEYPGLKPKDIILLKAISGDKSDNIIGIDRVGDKTAIKIVTKFKSVTEMFNNKDEISSIRGCSKVCEPENLDRVRLNKRIVKIPNSDKDIENFKKRDHISKQEVEYMMNAITAKAMLSKRRLSRIFGKYGLRKFKLQVLKGEKNFGKLLGLEMK